MTTNPIQESQAGLRIGIDVGGTNTDAVLMSGRKVLTESKHPTTEDVTTGAVRAIQAVLTQSAADPTDVDFVMVGTTHFVNAFVQRRELQPVGIVRIGLPMTSGIPPLIDWPEDLCRAVGRNIHMVSGGSYYTGVEYTPLDTSAIRAAARQIRDQGLTAVAISSVFAPIRPDLELRAGEIIREIAGDIAVTLSHEVGGFGLIERENAAVINAALTGLSVTVVEALERALESLQLKARLYFTQNDGTLMGTEVARRFPVMTSSAGPTNSIRGAAFLSGLEDAVVVDIGGTTSDVGVLRKGFARETIESFEMGGVRTNFMMPDILSIGLGGGTIVRMDDKNQIVLGPESVGYLLHQEALVFGGNTLTATDIAVARGGIDIGDSSQLKGIDDSMVKEVSGLFHRRVESVIDQLKTSATEVPVVLVGGGSILIDSELAGASEVIRPQHGAVANAIGAAIAQVGGRVRKMYDYGELGGRDAALELATEEAKVNAIEAGALADTLKVVDIEEFPMTHMQTNAVEVRIRVVGNLDCGIGDRV